MESQNCTYFSFCFYFFGGFSIYCLWAAAWIQKRAKWGIIMSAVLLLMLQVLCDFISVVLYTLCIHVLRHFYCIVRSSLFLVYRADRIHGAWSLFCFFFRVLWLTKGTAHNSLKDCCTKFFDTIIHWFPFRVYFLDVSVCARICVRVWVWWFDILKF